tara:strand:+ start:1680 stop:2270 length:591 start_codon:yes stop_codon:yes gene_type:complete
MLMVVALLAYDPFPGAHLTALLVFLFAALTDWLDGWLARRMGQTSDFGKFMDALSDKILVLGMFVSLLALDKGNELAGWALFPVLLILSREFLITGLRLAAAAQGVILAAERAGKIKTVLQLCCLTLFLAELALEHDASVLFPKASVLYQDEIIFLSEWISVGAVVALLAATIITVTSGIGYMLRHGNLFFGEKAG